MHTMDGMIGSSSLPILSLLHLICLPIIYPTTFELQVAEIYYSSLERTEPYPR